MISRITKAICYAATFCFLLAASVTIGWNLGWLLVRLTWLVSQYPLWSGALAIVVIGGSFAHQAWQAHRRLSGSYGKDR